MTDHNSAGPFRRLLRLLGRLVPTRYRGSRLDRFDAEGQQTIMQNRFRSGI